MNVDRICVLLLDAYYTLFPGKPRFRKEDMPDLTGKVAVVTGGNSGIGYEVVKGLLEHNAKVYLAGRDRAKMDEAIEQLQRETGNRAIPLVADLTKKDSIKAAAKELLSKEQVLHILVNNAGIGSTNQLTEGGVDLVFAANVLGPFYLTQLLMSALIKGAPTAPGGKARIVNVSSVMHTVGWLDFETLKESEAWRRRPRHSRYSQSKLANVVISNELARRYGDQGIVSTAVNPGSIDTPIYRTAPNLQRWAVAPTQFDASFGAITPLWAASSDETLALNGAYLVPWARIGRALAVASDPAVGKKLWDWCEAEVGSDS